MGLRFHRSIGLSKGLRLNIGKSGVGLSAGVKGAHVSFNTNGRKTTSVGIPGTGISYIKTEKIGGGGSGGANDIPPSTGNNQYADPGQLPKKKHGCGTFLIIGISLLVVFGIIGSCSGGSGSSSSSQVSVASTPLISSSTISSGADTSEILSSSELSSIASSSSTASVAIPSSAIAKPVSTSSKAPAANSKISLTGAPGTVQNGSTATLSITGKPNTEYSISVYYSSGASKADGLEAKTSESNGKVSWTWKIGANTKAGTHRIVIDGGGEKIETSITTTK